MILLLREHPEWLRALVEVVTKRTLPTNLTLTDSAIRVVDPAEVRLDLVLTSADGASWVLVEVQLDEDAAKARKWPLAVAALWNERGVPGDLLVITSDRAVAAWARTVGQMDGPSGTTLVVRPVVVQLTGDVAEILLDPAPDRPFGGNPATARAGPSVSPMRAQRLRASQRGTPRSMAASASSSDG